MINVTKRRIIVGIYSGINQKTGFGGVGSIFMDTDPQIAHFDYRQVCSRLLGGMKLW